MCAVQKGAKKERDAAFSCPLVSRQGIERCIVPMARDEAMESCAIIRCGAYGCQSFVADWLLLKCRKSGGKIAMNRQPGTIVTPDNMRPSPGVRTLPGRKIVINLFAMRLRVTLIAASI